MTVTIQDNASCHRLDGTLPCQVQAVDDRPRGEQSTPELSTTAPWEQLMLTVITQRSRGRTCKTPGLLFLPSFAQHSCKLPTTTPRNAFPFLPDSPDLQHAGIHKIRVLLALDTVVSSCVPSPTEGSSTDLAGSVASVEVIVPKDVHSSTLWMSSFKTLTSSTLWKPSSKMLPHLPDGSRRPRRWPRLPYGGRPPRR